MIFIVLPAYNEELTLPPLLDAIGKNLDESALSYRVLIVDDGSADKTAAVIAELSKTLPITPLSHQQNRGLAEAMKTGLMAAVTEAGSRDIIVTMDSDNTHNPGLILRMVRLIREGHDVVVASRYVPGARVIGVPLTRKFLSFWASLLFRVLFPICGVRDYTSGFRAYRSEVLKDMFNRYGDSFIDEPGFSCMVDILLKMRKYPLIIGEVPLILRYDQKEGASKMNVARTVRQTLKLIVKRRFAAC